MITVGEIRRATEGMSDHAELKLEVVPEGHSWRLELVFTEHPAQEVFHNRHPHLPPRPPSRPEPYNANALRPGAPASLIDPRD